MFTAILDPNDLTPALVRQAVADALQGHQRPLANAVNARFATNLRRKE